MHVTPEEQATADAAAAQITEQLKKEAQDARAQLAKQKVENLRDRIARENDLTAEAAEFLSGQDEETLRSQAEKLGKMAKAPPAQAGTQQPSIDEQIESAQKAGNLGLSITLKRQKAGINLVSPRTL